MLFSSRKPLYFVFHDRSERYFQDSTLQLTFSEWLWLTLRKRGYSNIYFVDLDDTGRPVLTLRDRDTWRGYTPGGICRVCIRQYQKNTQEPALQGRNESTDQGVRTLFLYIPIKLQSAHWFFLKIFCTMKTT